MTDWQTRFFRRFMGFSAVGLVSTVVSAAILFVGVEVLNRNAVAVYVIAYVITLVGAYFANSIWVFHVGVSVIECMKFFGIYASGMIIGATALRSLELLFSGTSPFLLGIGVMPLTIGWNFFFVNYVMEKFRHRIGGAQ